MISTMSRQWCSFRTISFMELLTLLSFIFMVFSYVSGHGCMVFPNQRGALSAKAPFVVNPISEAYLADVDFWMHFPAGDKSERPGAGIASQRYAAGRQGWVPYNPYDRKFRWRANPCGDSIFNRDHQKGGKYYNGGLLSATFNQGDILDVQMAVSAHHNGFIELHLCDVSKCNGDISPKCFQNGYCTQLKRAGRDACESRYNRYCSPIDPNYPGRWYLPCESAGKRMRHSDGGKWLLYGPGTIRYQLPPTFFCVQCVLQWYWTSANECNPPGLAEYFTSNRAPKWGRCRGQAGAIGGWTASQKSCGGREQFPEEYYQCSDIRIRKK